MRTRTLVSRQQAQDWNAVRWLVDHVIVAQHDRTGAWRRAKMNDSSARIASCRQKRCVAVLVRQRAVMFWPTTRAVLGGIRSSRR